MMQFIKGLLLFGIFFLSVIIGKYISNQYKYRLLELEEIKNALNIFKTKIKFTYEPIAVIFTEIADSSGFKSISNLFSQTIENTRTQSAENSWLSAVNNMKGYLKDEDKDVIKKMSKMLGTTDIEGQISQIEVTESFLDEKIRQAQEEKNKNEKLYQKLGITIGLAIVIILV